MLDKDKPIRVTYNGPVPARLQKVETQQENGEWLMEFGVKSISITLDSDSEPVVTFYQKVYETNSETGRRFTGNINIQD